MEAGMVAAVVLLTLDDGRTEEVALEQSDTVGPSLFRHRYDIVAATIPEGVTTIGDRAFEFCDSLASVTIPESVTAIGAYAFDDCGSLASVTIPDGVTAIKQDTFSGCSSLAPVTIPDGVTTIEEGAFCECESLASVTIPDGVTTIEKETFLGCTSLTRVSIMNTTAKIRRTAFFASQSINRVNIHDNVKVIFVVAGRTVEKRIREMYQGRPAWQHVFPTCPAANIKWHTSVREKYEAGFVDRTTAMAMLMSMRRTREDPRFTGSFPAEMMENVLEYAV